MKSQHLIILCVVLMICSSGVFAAKQQIAQQEGKSIAAKSEVAAMKRRHADPRYTQLAEGQAAFNAHDYKKAFTLWHKLAQKGHVEAQVFVGLAYKNGWGVRKDQHKAAMWFQIAAEGGNPSAQFFIGLNYLGSRNPEMVPIGINWLVKAARNGENNARQFLIKAKQRRWFQVPDNLDVKTKVTRVTASNIDKVFTGKPQTTDKSSSSAEQSLQQARAQIQQSSATLR